MTDEFVGAARTCDPRTSHEAGLRVDAEGLCAAVADAVRAAGARGLTSLEAAARLGPPGLDPVAYLQSISPRFAQLERLGTIRLLLDADGEPARRDRRQVWVVAAYARAAMPAKSKLLDRFGKPLSDSYCTPRWLTGLLPLVDVDPCGNPRSTVRARRAYSLETRLDGLQLPWQGTVFLNWPYSAPGPWATKLAEELTAGRCTEAIVLCKLDTSTAWWRTLTSHGQPELWMFDKRLLFDEPPALVEARIARGGSTKSSTDFCSVVVHHRGTRAPLALDVVATRWCKAP
jgi:hypothetical protein